MGNKKIGMSTWIKVCASALVLSFSTWAQAVDPDKTCPQFFFHGTPVHAIKKVSDSSYFICHKAYSVQYYLGTKTPLWVAERLSGDATVGDEPRTEDFQKDPEVEAKHSSSNKDFQALNRRLKARLVEDGRGEKYVYDRGHMAPAGDFATDGQAMLESFNLSNMVPQVSSHNRGVWKDLEVRVRNWARGRGTLFIVTGPVFRSKAGYQDMRGLEEMNGVLVPTDIYKLIVDPKTGGSIAFVIPNLPFQPAGGRKDSKGYEYNGTTFQLQDFIVPIREIEMITGINFHPFLNKSDADTVELKKSGMWTR